jgi:hypothetical protein
MIMFDTHREIIREFIDEDISTINMYWGYKGDFVLKITTKDPTLAFEIEDFAIKEIGIEAVTKQESDTGIFDVFCC